MADNATDDAVVNDNAAAQDDWLLDTEDDSFSDDTEGKGDSTTDETDDEAESSKDGKSEEGSDNAEQSADKSGEGEGDEQKPDAGKPDEGKPDTAKQSDDDEAATKRHNDEMAKQRIRSKDALKAGAQQFVDNARAKIDEAGDDEVKRELASIHAKEAEREANEFLRTVEHNESIIRTDHSRIAQEFPMFNPGDTEHFNQRAYDRALSHLAPHLVTQEVQYEDGSKDVVIVGSDVSVYEFLKGEAQDLQELLGAASSAATIKGQQAEQKMRSASETPSSGAPRGLSKDDQEAKDMSDAFSGM